MFVTRTAVVGAGIMGGQIAQTIAAAGFDVVLKDVASEMLDTGVETARGVTAAQVERLVTKGALTREQADARIEDVVGRIRPTTAYDGFGGVDLVIEAVPERLALKRQVFSELDAVTPGHAILASNTSGLSVSELGDATVRPDMVVGFHYFYPAAVMPLVEVVRGDDTSPETVTAAYNFALALGKRPIVCADAPGFVVNRILFSALSEVMRAQEQRGLSTAAVDKAIEAQGVSPMPPYRLIDLLGLDTILHVAEHLNDCYGERIYVHRGMRELVAAGKLGAKTGSGFLGGEPALEGSDDAGLGAELAELQSHKALVEACLVLEEGISTMREIDLGLMAGAGFEPRRGLLPPFLQADAAGLDVVLARLEALEAEHGERFAPPTTLRRLVAQGRLGVSSGQGFYAYPRPDEGDQRETVKLETCGDGVAIAWLCHGTVNAISATVLDDLADVRDRAVAAGVRALVIASASSLAFSAGSDVKDFSRLDDGAIAELTERGHRLFSSLGDGDLITIAAVNALAFGGGNELAMACDVRIAAESATFAQPEIKLGIIPGEGATQRLARLIGAGRALEMNLLGDALLADDALERGLVNRVVPDHELLDSALAWARRLASQPPRAVRAIKGLAADAALAAGLEAERGAFVDVLATRDAREGIGAFLAKRAARWTGS